MIDIMVENDTSNSAIEENIFVRYISNREISIQINMIIPFFWRNIHEKENNGIGKGTNSVEVCLMTVMDKTYFVAPQLLLIIGT